MELTRNQIKLVKSLNRKKERQELGLFVAEGRKTVLEALKSGWQTEMLFHLKENHEFEQYPNAIMVSNAEMERMTALSSPSEALAVFKIPKLQFSNDRTLSNLLFFLDGIQDPGNLGTIIRIADWYGINTLFCSDDCVDTFNPKTVQASMGSVFHLPVYRLSLEAIKSIIGNERTIYAADLEGDSIWTISTAHDQNCLVIIGSEAHGISSASLNTPNKRITIPGKGQAESLNAAVSAGIIASALLRE